MAIYKGATLRNDLKELIQESPMGTVEFAGSKVLPEIVVNEKSGNIPVLSTSAGMKQLDLKRAPRSSFQRAAWVWSDDSFNSFEYGYEEPIDNVEALENADIFNEEVVSADIARNQLFLAREKRIADAVYNSTTFAAAADKYTLTNEWDDATNAAPFADISAAFDKLFAKIGRPRSACHLLINDIIFRNVIRSDEVRADVKYTTAIDKLSAEQKAQFLAEFLAIAKVDIVTSFADTTKLGVEDAVFGRLWSNEYSMLYIPAPAVNSWKVPGLGRQPVYSKFSSDYIIESYDEKQTDSRIIRAREYRGEYVNKTFGVLMDNMTT